MFHVVKCLSFRFSISLVLKSFCVSLVNCQYVIQAAQFPSSASGKQSFFPARATSLQLFHGTSHGNRLTNSPEENEDSILQALPNSATSAYNIYSRANRSQ